MKKALLLFTSVVLLILHSFAQKIPLSKVFSIAQIQGLNFQINIMSSTMGSIQCSKADTKEKMKMQSDIQLRDKYSTFETIFEDDDYLPMKDVDSNMISRFQGDQLTNGIMFFGLMYEKVFNTLKTNHRERAKLIFDEVAGDFFKTVYESKVGSSYTHIGFVINIAIRDFSKGDQSYNNQSESLIFVAPVNAIKKFNEAAITDDQLLGLCKVYSLTNGSKAFRLTALKNKG